MFTTRLLPFLMCFASPLLLHADEADLKPLLSKPILPPQQTLKEAQKFIEARLPVLPQLKSKEDWAKEAQRLRKDMFAKVIFRGAAADWRQTKPKVEWLETLPGGPGYRLKQVRYEALPGLWIPALLYEPEKLSGKVPATLNVMGHDPKSKDVDYQQIRCINLAKRGMLALNVEWFAFGQLAGPGNRHGCMNQLDLCGTSGLAPFYLALERGLDVLLSHPHADPKRVAVSGLSGGGWQTIYISALDQRVTLTNPVAGYSSFRTRVQHFKDLGDSEQTPCDMATVADYDHLTALMAPRATLLTYNAKDECCFEAGYALPPLLEGALPFFKLYERGSALRGHVNEKPGTHNYEKDNREAFYRMVGEHFFPGATDYSAQEIDCVKELRPRQELAVPLPKNLDFNQVALNLVKNLPRDPELPKTGDAALAWLIERRAELAKIIRLPASQVQVEKEGTQKNGAVTATFWKLRQGNDWTIPVVELVAGQAQGTTLVMHDAGRGGALKEIDQLLKGGQRVLAVDPFFFGECRIQQRDFLWALLIGAVGERPLGIQVSQVQAVARWSARAHGKSVDLLAVGPRSSLISLVAAGLETQAMAGLEMHGSLGSLKEAVEQNRSYDQSPELFCFGLLERFDVKQLAALAVPRPVHFANLSPRGQLELVDLAEWQRLWKAK